MQQCKCNVILRIRCRYNKLFIIVKSGLCSFNIGFVNLPGNPQNIKLVTCVAFSPYLQDFILAVQVISCPGGQYNKN